MDHSRRCVMSKTINGTVASLLAVVAMSAL